jgi:ubiquinone/menaquinone biosynthesis C-methylase UbiE
MTQVVDYDLISEAFDRRYAEHDYAGVERALLFFLGARDGLRVLDVGCGTGHWLAVVANQVSLSAGTDSSQRMLAHAKRSAGTALLVRGRAEGLPWRAAFFDRVFCVNAFHHFSDKAAFIAEARRVLCPGGGLMIVGLDPHTGSDRWWIYDYFGPTLDVDKGRYPPSEETRQAMAKAGFVRCETTEAQHFSSRVSAHKALTQGLLDRSTTSQLTLLSAGEYEDGLARIRTDIESAAARGSELMLRTELRLYATVGWVEGWTK